MAAKRILIIDDEADIREVAHLSLEMVGGWHVLTAQTGEEGIALARAERPDAILLDFMMPDMDGLTTVRHLQADPACAGIPVLLLTGKAMGQHQLPFNEAGVVAVIAKPFDPLTLPDQVSRALGWEV